MIHIQAKEKSFYIRILDDVGRIIYENQCVNQVHYEYVRYVLAKWVSGEKIDNSMLKPLQNINRNVTKVTH